VISPSQGLYPHRTTQHRKTRTNIHDLSGIRTHDPSNQPAKTRASDRTATVTGNFRLCDSHISKCSPVRRVIVLILTFFIKLNGCSQGQVLPNTDNINKTCFLISGNYFSSQRVTQYYKKYAGRTKHIGGPHV
jgi:hypothetical protein